MQPQWIPRTVDGPAADLLTLEEVAKLLGFGVATLRRLITDGEFPDGITLSPGTKVWDWRAVTYYRLRAEMRPRLAKQTGANGEQSTPND